VGRVQQHRNILSQQVLEYIRRLETRVHQLEWDKKQICDLNSNADTMDSYENNSVATSSEAATCPPAIAEAMRVLQIRDSLNSETSPSRDKERTEPSNLPNAGSSSEMEEMLFEQQQAIVSSFCDVVWRKIEDGS
jgi:hypothetical protein